MIGSRRSVLPCAGGYHYWRAALYPYAAAHRGRQDSEEKGRDRHGIGRARSILPRHALAQRAPARGGTVSTGNKAAARHRAAAIATEWPPAAAPPGRRPEPDGGGGRGPAYRLLRPNDHGDAHLGGMVWEAEAGGNEVDCVRVRAKVPDGRVLCTNPNCDDAASDVEREQQPFRS